MLERASWILRAGFLLSLLVSVVQAENITIRFTDLDAIARDKAPRAKIIEAEYARSLAERDADLQWSNPEIAYDREEVDEIAEYQLTVGKQFEVPWVSLKKRSSWSDRISAAGHIKEKSMRANAAGLKAGYVRLRLLDEYLYRLGQLREILTDASHVATSRHSEGHISGVEEHLIQMSVISLNASHQAAMQERRELFANWGSSLGFHLGDNIELATNVDFKFVDLKSAEEYAGLLESQPDFRSKSLLAESFRKRASAERGRFVPNVDLYAGLKKVEPDFDGYVAGVSLSLPLFNRNGANARQYQLESDIIRSELELLHARAVGQVNALTESILESQEALASAAPHFTEDSEEINNLLYSYEEGWLTLSELLNAIQIEITGSQDYYEQLTRYYENLFQLETITGENLVSF